MCGLDVYLRVCFDVCVFMYILLQPNGTYPAPQQTRVVYPNYSTQQQAQQQHYAPLQPIQQQQSQQITPVYQTSASGTGECVVDRRCCVNISQVSRLPAQL